MAMWNYDTIKTLAKDQGLRVTDLIALAPNNDPFYFGTPGDLLWGEWFAGLWRRFGYTSGVHIRRVHYRTVSQETPVIMPDGTPYENTERCWDKLTMASKAARYLRLVDPAAFVDQRNPEPHLFTAEPVQPTIEVYQNFWGGQIDLPDFPELPGYVIENYAGQQRYHIELWCEKSTMNDVLLPLCRHYGANLVTGVGELSITACLDLVRKRLTGRALRILYISDFDPAGMSMPVAVARKVEYFLVEHESGADVRVYPVVLTAGQVQEYRLPRIPIKESERRAGKFEERFGEGAVELDALEALHPGALQRIVQREIKRYHDADLWERVSEERDRLREKLSEIEQRAYGAHSEDIERLRATYQEIRQEFTAKVAGVQEEIDRIWQAISAVLEDETPDMQDYWLPEAEQAAEPAGALFDSQREYGEQIDAYKSFQGKA